MTENKNCTGAEMCKRAFERYEETSNPFIRYCDHHKEVRREIERERRRHRKRKEENAESTFAKR